MPSTVSRNDGAADTILDNGTFLNAGLDPNSSLIPSFGYNEAVEIVSDYDRKRFGLPPKERMHDLDDKANQQINAISRDSDWIDYTATISTDPDQIRYHYGLFGEGVDEKMTAAISGIEWTRKWRTFTDTVG